MTARIALISGLREQNKLMAERLLSLGDFNIVYRGGSLTRNFRQLVKTHPDVVVITIGSPGTFSHEIKPTRLKKLTKLLPDTKVLMRTELNRDDPFVLAVIECGVSVIADSIGWVEIVEAIEKIRRGENLELLGSGERKLDTYRGRRPERAG